MMSLFNLPATPKEKTKSVHPWLKIIKEELANKTTYAHKSIRNVVYPKPKEKVPPEKRARFTVIGNRVTKEFIYCVHLVQGMHKYRWKKFDKPVIKGVTGVEWPHVLNELKSQYGGLSFCFSGQVAIIYNDNFLGGMTELKNMIESKYCYHLALNYERESVWQFIRFIKSIGRPCAYFHISLGNERIGTLIFMLYSDICPVTCENFLRLCNTRRGGYSGTPIHRIVKDGWIQCGGFGLKSTNMSCENFIVPHDRRGVLGMCNDGRHLDCSTQFFVLLQPAPWMKGRFVAFGQLIEGEQTLKRIEKVPTFYESPALDLTIFKTGILNVDCHDIKINRSANEYIESHIEDLVAVGDIFYQMLLEHVFLEVEFRIIARLESQLGEHETVEGEDLGATKRFVTKLQKIREAHQTTPTKQSEKADTENNDFDVDNYSYEGEHYSYDQVTPRGLTPIEKPKMAFYIPLTDVRYPGEVDSDFDLKRFLQGDYCLLSDLDTVADVKKKCDSEKLNKLSKMLESYHKWSDEEVFAADESTDLDSEEEREITKCLQLYGEQICISGTVIRNIARNFSHINLPMLKGLFTDEDVRRMKLAKAEIKVLSSKPKKQVKMNSNTSFSRMKSDSSHLSSDEESMFRTQSHIRRPTGFVKPAEIAEYLVGDDDEGDDDGRGDADGGGDDEDKADVYVKIDADAEDPPRQFLRRPTGFVRPGQLPVDEDDDDDDNGDDARCDSNKETSIKPSGPPRESTLKRLYKGAKLEDDNFAPTLKDYVPLSERFQNNLLLTFGKRVTSSSGSLVEPAYKVRHSVQEDNAAFNRVANVQYGEKVAAKMSDEYFCRLTQMEAAPVPNSLRTLEYSRIRPSMTVAEYRRMNQQKLKMIENEKASQTKK